MLGLLQLPRQLSHQQCQGWLLLTGSPALISLVLSDHVLEPLNLEKRLIPDVLDLFQVRNSELLDLTPVLCLEARTVPSLCLLLLGPLSLFLLTLVLLLLDLYLSDVLGGPRTICILVGVPQLDGERRDVLEVDTTLVICET